MEEKVDRKKGPEPEVVSKNPDWRYGSGAEVSVLPLVAQEGGEKFLKERRLSGNHLLDSCLL